MVIEEFSIEDLVDNPTPRIPIAMVLDTSASMAGAPIKELNKGVNLFIEEIRRDEYTRYSAEICIVTFGGSVEIIQDFATVDYVSYPVFKASGETPMGTAVLKTLELLERRKTLYKELGIDYYQPWIVLMTDGRPTDDITKAVRKVQELISQRRLVVFPIAIGPYADIDSLSLFTIPDIPPPPLKLKGLKFKEFFIWLSKSVAQVSRSTPGMRYEISLDDVEDWSELS